MNLLAFSGSPRKAAGATDRVLDHFLDGAKEAGAQIEKIFIAEKKINYCAGCLNCWAVHPGKCIHHDDMPDILQKIDAADLLVYASPVYVDGVSGQMKTLLDRHISICLPYIEYEEGHMRHPRRQQVDPRRKMVFISVCGFRSSKEKNCFLALK
jgi:multimeric flavodoxin WrbA